MAMNQDVVLSRTSGTPLHRQLFAVLRDGILSGVYQPGSALPKEEALCERFGVSRITVRRTLEDLKAEGLIEKRQGRGTFVTVRTPESSLFNFFRLRNPDGTLDTPKLERETVRRRPAGDAERDVQNAGRRGRQEFREVADPDEDGGVRVHLAGGLDQLGSKIGHHYGFFAADRLRQHLEPG